MYNLSQEVMAHILCNVSDGKPALNRVQYYSDSKKCWVDSENYHFNLRTMIFDRGIKYRVMPKDGS